MIDFRYHVVSLVAVFLALAVGIALGAGPLREGVSAALESQVQELREERAGLRSELDQTQARAEAKEQLIADVAPLLADGQLEGVRVATVLLPGAPDALAETSEESLRQGGATVVASTELEDWGSDPAESQTWAEVTAELEGALEEPSVAEGEASTPATMLAAVLTASDARGARGSWRTAEDRLVELGLIEVDRDQPGTGPVPPGAPPEAVVVVAGGLTPEEVTEGAGAEALQRRLELLTAMGAGDVPVLVVGQGTEATTTGDVDPRDPLIVALRDTGAVRDAVSSVDNGEGASGQLSVVTGLARALSGETGHYGLGPGADALTPVIVPSQPPDPPADTVTEPPPGDEADATEGLEGDDAGMTEAPVP